MFIFECGIYEKYANENLMKSIIIIYIIYNNLSIIWIFKI